MSGVELLDARAAGLVPRGSRLEELASGCVWSEGPVWLREDASVLWSDIPNNRLMYWHPDRGAHVWKRDVEFTNGHAREASGALLHCSHGRRAIVRTRLDEALLPGEDEIVVDRFQGKRLNSPNDVVVKSDGTIWFTDPPYGILSDHEGHQAESELEANHVFCFDPATGELTAVSDVLEEPNGLAFSPDESILYVSDTSAALRADGSGNHHILAFDVQEGRRLVNPRVFAEINPGLPDGFCVDTQGWLYTSSADSVQVYAPDGHRLMKILVPEKVGNLTFGGPEGDQLFICASTSLYRIILNTRGTP
jgi:gluconolactonase